jgi:hypothetical protein
MVKNLSTARKTLTLCALLSSIALPTAANAEMLSAAGAQFQSRIVVPGQGDLLNPNGSRNLNSRFVTEGAQFTGVVGLRIFTNEGAFICSGALISPTQVLTAAHCLDSQTIFNVTVSTPNQRPNFGVGPLQAGPVQVVSATNIRIHPDYDPVASVGGGNDVAIINLGNALTDVDTYEIYRGNGEIGATHIKVGVGTTGFGETGNVDPNFGTFDGIKRAGRNIYEFFGRELFNDLLVANGIVGDGLAFGGPQDGILLFDFDSGLAQNDVFGNLIRAAQFANDPIAALALLQAATRLQTGVSIDGLFNEINSAGGDSGGPTFILDTDGVLRIAGITSFGITGAILDGTCGTAPAGSPPFIDPSFDNNNCTNSSFGEISGDTRVAAFQDFIDNARRGVGNFRQINVPEPASLALFGANLIGLAGLMRRKKTA